MTSVKSSNLVVVLDSPIVLDYLGCSGTEYQENVTPIIKQVQKIGAKLLILKPTVRECFRSLDAVLKTPAHQRIGVTATALRRREVLEDYIRHLLNNLEKEIKNKSINILSENEFRNKYCRHSNVEEGLYKRFYSAIGPYENDLAQDHDACILSLVIAARGDSFTNDLFSSKFVFLSRNSGLVGKSRREAVALADLAGGAGGPRGSVI